jgi:uncharacterized protein involved in exopolysaccharide biosynthesis
MSSHWSHPETIRELRRVIVRYRRRFALTFFSVTILVLFAGMLLPRQYEARAVFERRSDMVMSTVVGQGAPRSVAALKRSMSEELRGTPSIARVVEQEGLLPEVVEGEEESQRAQALMRQDLINHIAHSVRVSYDITTEELDRIRVSYIDQDPVRARRVVNGLVGNYIDRARAQIDALFTEAAEFFADQSQQYYERIEQLEEQILRFEVEHSTLLGSPMDVQDRQTAAEEELVSLQRKQQALEMRVERLRQELGELIKPSPASIVKGKNPEYGRLERQLEAIQSELDRAILVEKKTERHPSVVALRRQAEQVEQQLRATPVEVVTQRVYGESSKRTSIEMALLEAKNERDALEEELVEAERKVARLRADASRFLPIRSELRRLNRELSEAREQFKFWEDKRRSVELALTAELGEKGITLDFVQPCGQIERPVSPDPLQIFFAALGLGGLVAVGTVLLADRSDQTLRSVEQANSLLNVPVLGTVAEIISERQAAWRRTVHQFLMPALMAVMVAVLIAAAYINYLSLRKPYMLRDRDQNVQVTDAALLQATAKDASAETR